MDPMDELEAIRIANEMIVVRERLNKIYDTTVDSIYIQVSVVRALLARATRPHD